MPETFAIVAVCDYHDIDEDTLIEATAWVIGDEGMSAVCGSELCAAKALDDVGPNPEFHPHENPPKPSEVGTA